MVDVWCGGCLCGGCCTIGYVNVSSLATIDKIFTQKSSRHWKDGCGMNDRVESWQSDNAEWWKETEQKLRPGALKGEPPRAHRLAPPIVKKTKILRLGTRRVACGVEI